MRGPRILVVGDGSDRGALAELLELMGYEVDQTSVRSLAAAACAQCPDVVIADAQFPASDGRAMFAALATLRCRPLTILISARPTTALDHLGVHCIAKPIDLAHLRSLIEPALERGTGT